MEVCTEFTELNELYVYSMFSVVKLVLSLSKGASKIEIQPPIKSQFYLHHSSILIYR